MLFLLLSFTKRLSQGLSTQHLFNSQFIVLIAKNGSGKNQVKISTLANPRQCQLWGRAGQADTGLSS